MARITISYGRAITERLAHQRGALTGRDCQSEGQEKRGTNHNYTHPTAQQAPRQRALPNMARKLTLSGLRLRVFRRDCGKVRATRTAAAQSIPNSAPISSHFVSWNLTNQCSNGYNHRTGQRLDPVVLIYGNGHVPFGPSAFRQAFRLQIEQRVQSGNHVSTVALSHIF